MSRWTNSTEGRTRDQRASFLPPPGQPLPGEVSAVGRLLYLGQVRLAQEGMYTCECSNVAGNRSQDQRLEVQGELDGWDLTRWGDWTPHTTMLPPLRPHSRIQAEMGMMRMQTYSHLQMTGFFTATPWGW